MNRFIWLASYPKSGNTWIRAFLSSVRQNGAPININQLDAVTQVSSRVFLDELWGIGTADLTPAEILHARPQALFASRDQASVNLCKVHEAWQRNAQGLALFPSELTKASIYIVRDPRDVAISFAHHLGKSIDEVIDMMQDPEAALSGSTNRLGVNTIQPLLTWSQHVESWLDHAEPAPLLVRYEDMQADPVAQGARIAHHAGLDKPQTVYEQAVHHSSFLEMTQQEAQQGFNEARAPDRRFFRSGRVGAWKTILTPLQVNKIEQTQGHVMKRLGYQLTQGQ